MRRRTFIARLASLVAISCSRAKSVRAQQPAKLPTIGLLSPSSSRALLNEQFYRGLRELGYIDGRNVIIVSRFADGMFDRLPKLAAELVAMRVDVIVAVVTQASLAARNATKTIPIVMLGVSDPLGAGLVESLARPGGNVTGTSGMSSEVVGKSLEVLKEAVPALTRVAILWNPANVVFQGQTMREAERAASALGLSLQAFGARGLGEFDAAFAAIAKANVQAMLVMPDPVNTLHVSRIIDFAQRSRLPAMYATREQAMAGGLIVYGPDLAEQFRRGAAYVDRILKGANTADLPVEQVTKFELIINLKAAKAIGLTVPNSLLVRADEVIE
jgi:putative tryptophan/tyrosine transport system substrate-binding protein